MPRVAAGARMLGNARDSYPIRRTLYGMSKYAARRWCPSTSAVRYGIPTPSGPAYYRSGAAAVLWQRYSVPFPDLLPELTCWAPSAPV